MQHAPGIDPLEALVLEGQILGIGRAHLGCQPFELEPSPDELDGMLGEVDPGCEGPGAHKTDEVRPCADPDLEQALTLRTLEVRETGDVRIELISHALDFSEELGASFGRGGMLRPAGLLLPEVANSSLLIYCRGRRGQRLGLY